MPPKKKVQAKSVGKDEDHSEEEEQTTKTRGRGKSKDDSKDDAPETRRSGRIAKAQSEAKNGKKKAANSPDDETHKKKAGKKVKGGKKKAEESEEEEEEDDEMDEEDDKKGSKKEPAKMVKAITKGGVAVDNLCDLKSKAHVYVDGGKVYSATLNQSNIKKNANKVSFAFLRGH